MNPDSILSADNLVDFELANGSATPEPCFESGSLGYINIVTARFLHSTDYPRQENLMTLQTQDEKLKNIRDLTSILSWIISFNPSLVSNQCIYSCIVLVGLECDD